MSPVDKLIVEFIVYLGLLFFAPWWVTLSVFLAHWGFNVTMSRQSRERSNGR